MSADWQHQVRVYLPEKLANLARTDHTAPVLRPLLDILNSHYATLVSQLDAFETYLADAEREGLDKDPLYKWTKATVQDPAKRLKHLQAFALQVSGQGVYPKETADALETALQPFVGGSLITHLSRHDTNPANNQVIPAEYRS
jgi:hypothetical protein